MSAATELQPALDEARKRIARAARQPGGLCVLTGAGMSAESGIPTFRDAMTGLWSRFDPAQLASEEGFRADPARVWTWYAERRAAVLQAQPNAGHLALGEFARRRPGVLALVTQNVDDLHQRAGNAETIRLHGDILADRWLQACPHGRDCPTDRARADRPPRCGDCGNLLRPGVVWFGEMLPPGALECAERAAGACQVMLVVGTSGAVWPAAGLAGIARGAGVWVAIVNPCASEIDDQAHAVLRGTAAALLPRLLRP
jgi:NAD-dependent deacetylase